jgi:hypothetical protein
VTLTLDAVITAARDRHPAFFITHVTDAVLARYLSDYQNELIAKAVTRDRQYLAQTAVVTLSMQGGTVGAGNDVGGPGTSSDGAFSTTEASTGSLVEAGLTSDDGAAVLISETPVTGATPTTLTKTGAVRTVNGDVGLLLVITQGTAIGEVREVLSNTASQWTISTGSDGEEWAVTPDTTSMFQLVQPTLISDDTAGVVTSLPSVTYSRGYLVKVNASGVPFIDYAEPLVATVEAGVPLPAMQALLPDLCQLWPTGSTRPEPLTVTSAQRRFSPENTPAIYTVGQTLYLCGVSGDWADVASLELRYTPIAPVFTGLTDVFLLPDHARPALVAQAAAFMALRVEGNADVSIDAGAFAVQGQRAEADYLRAVLLGKRGRSPRIREVW